MIMLAFQNPMSLMSQRQADVGGLRLLSVPRAHSAYIVNHRSCLSVRLSDSHLAIKDISDNICVWPLVPLVIPIWILAYNKYIKLDRELNGNIIDFIIAIIVRIAVFDEMNVKSPNALLG